LFKKVFEYAGEYHTKTCEVIAVYGVFYVPFKSFYSQSPRLTAMNSCLDRLEAVFARKPLPNEGKDRIPSQGGTVARQGGIYRNFVTARESSRSWNRSRAAG
jgi:hypothetical protein